MKRSIIIGTIILLESIFLIAAFDPNNPFLSILTITPEYDVIRMALIVLLLALVFTAPPRSVHFRIILSAVSAALFIGTTAMMLNYEIRVMDALIFIQVAVIFALEAAEASVLETIQLPKKSRRRTI